MTDVLTNALISQKQYPLSVYVYLMFTVSVCELSCKAWVVVNEHYKVLLPFCSCLYDCMFVSVYLCICVCLQVCVVAGCKRAIENFAILPLCQTFDLFAA